MTTTNRPAGGTVTHTGTQIKSQANGYSFGPDDTYSRFKGFFDADYKKAWEEFQEKLAEEAARQAEANAHAEKARVEAEKEQALAIVRDREARIKDLHDYNEELADQIRSFSAINVSLTMSNYRGGVGKSTLAAYIASILAEDSRCGTVLIDNNEMGGTAAAMLGLEHVPGMTVRPAYALLEQNELRDSGDYLSRLPKTRHGVFLLASDEVVEQQDFYTDTTSEGNIKLARRHAQLVVNDTGNGIQHSAMSGVLRNTNVLLVPTLPTRLSMKGATTTIANYRKWGYTHLADRAIVVVVGIMPGRTLEDYRKAMDLPESQLLFAVPDDERGRMNDPVNLKLTDFYVSLAYREIALAALLVAHAPDHAGSAKRLSELRTGKLVELPSGRTGVRPWIDGSDRLI